MARLVPPMTAVIPAPRVGAGLLCTIGVVTLLFTGRADRAPAGTIVAALNLLMLFSVSACGEQRACCSLRRRAHHTGILRDGPKSGARTASKRSAMAEKDTEFQGEWVLLAGGMGSIGGALAERFSALGARLVMIYLSEASIYRFREDHPRPAKDAYFVRLHGLEPERVVSDLAPAVLARGEPNIFINVVGGLMEEAGTGRGTSDGLARNYQAALELGNCAVTCMQAGGGHIVAVGGEFAQTSGAPADTLQRVLSAHTATLALSALTHRINVNAVLPGLVDTPRNRLQFAEQPENAWVRLEDMVHVVEFLCSQRARAITGQTFSLTGWV